MNKILNLLLKVSLFVFLFSGILGLYLLSIEQYEYAIRCAKVGGFASLVFTAIVIGEVMASKNAHFLTKFIWIAAFLMFQILAGIAYYMVDRKTINQQLELN